MPGGTDERQQIKKLLKQADDMYWSPEERALIDEALGLAQRIGDEKLEYKIRMRLTSSACMTGDTDAELSSFAWCLAKHDQDPKAFPESVKSHSLMWQFKWMIDALDGSPVFSLAQCDAMLDDMEAHYRRAGLGMSGVVGCRLSHAWSIGDLDQARELRTRLAEIPRDDYSDCEACTASQLAGLADELGEEELALELLDRIIDEDLSCADEPEGALASMLLTMLGNGRTEQARESHLRSYRMARHNPDNISIVADNLVFCAVTGNAARGLAMVERHIGWLAHDSLNQAGAFDMLCAIGAVLDAVVRTGHGDQIVRGAGSPRLVRFFGEREGAWTAEDLAAAVWAAAATLGEAFDKRNGNTYVSDQIRETKALLDKPYDLPIVTEVFLPPAPAEFSPSTAQQWLDLAEIYGYGYVADETITAATEVLAEGDASQRARALSFIVTSHVMAGRADEASGWLPARCSALREDDREAQAELEERLGLIMFGLESPDRIERLEAELTGDDAATGENRAMVEVALAGGLLQAEGAASPRVAALLEDALVQAGSREALRVSVLRMMMAARLTAEDWEGALGYAARILGSELSDGLRALVLTQRANLLGRLERYTEGAADADAVSRIYASYDVNSLFFTATGLAAALLRAAGRYDEEATRWRYSLRTAERAETPTTTIRYFLGRALANARHTSEAIEILWDVLKDEEEAGAEPGSRAETAEVLAAAFQAEERYGNAVAMLEQAAGLWTESGRPLFAARVLQRKAYILRGFDMFAESAETIAEAWGLIADVEDDGDSRGVRVNLLENWAFTKASMNDESALADIDKAVAIVEADPNGPFPWKLADLTDSRARVLMELDRAAEAVAAFQEAAEGYSATEDPASACGSRHLAAQGLAGPLGNPSGAVEMWYAALADADAATADEADMSDRRNSILLMLSEALESLGRTVEATGIRAMMTPES